MRSTFDLTDQIFSNADHFKVVEDVIVGFEPVDELIRTTGRCFSVLQDDDEGVFRGLKSKLWRLRASVLFSLRPFDAPELELTRQISVIAAEAVTVPGLDAVSRLRAI